ncbi:MAG: glycosyltransferase family 2 protein [Rhizobiaceae bacterium]
MRALRLSDEIIDGVVGRARTNGTSLQAELLVSNHCREADFFRAAAAIAGVEFVPDIRPNSLVLRELDGLAILRGAKGPRLVRALGDAGVLLVVVPPEAASYQRILERKANDPAALERLRIAPPSALRDAIIQRCEHLICDRSTSLLLDALPYCSSRTVMTGIQGFVAGGLLAATVAALALAPSWAMFGLHLFFTLFFCACIFLRVAAASQIDAARRVVALGRIDPATLPRYTVLVALHREAEIVPELLRALSALMWPRSKLEIMLVCEADDDETLEALAAHDLRPWVEIVHVPPGRPRTKPKALAHALQLATGDFVALYDAEDKPHPLQLMEAYHRFRTTDDGLACVQAPLEISNGDRSLIARLFAFEYSALFRGILPFLSDNGLILPLGGTSNHFRRNALEKMGGWDPYNVTEDADLGLRMCRFGYRTETICYPTYEAAPENWKDWRNQRTRWLKGWIQTWLVHMRNPGRLAGELGWRSFVISQILFAGMVISALVHPVLLATIAWLGITLIVNGSGSVLMPAIVGIDMANILMGYGAYILLGRTTLPRSKRRGLWIVILCTPAYWLMQSFAAWRAVYQLWRDPHLWEKTPHPATRR